MNYEISEKLHSKTVTSFAGGAAPKIHLECFLRYAKTWRLALTLIVHSGVGKKESPR